MKLCCGVLASTCLVGWIGTTIYTIYVHTMQSECRVPKRANPDERAQKLHGQRGEEQLLLHT